MKLSKQQEIEMMQAYYAYWKNYLKGDVKSMASLLAKGYTQVGSAESEVFFNKKDAVKFLRDTIEQVAGKLDMRNRVIKPEQQGDFNLVHEQCDLYARDGKKWIFYAKFRASSLMQKKKDGWKFIHQHSSFPDTKTEEGQNIAIDKIAEENLQLREAVKRRTTELEQKNRELEIETALEKVRAIAMGMNEPADMLNICKTIAGQLQSLGVHEIRNVQTAIFYEDKGTYMNYEYYAKHDKTIITETSYTNHKIHIDFAAQMLKGKGEFFTTQIKGKKKLSDWIAYQKTTNVFIDPLIETAKSLNYYWYSLGPVALGTSTYQPLTEDETGLFKRFLKVFELSYRRYLDIEKAEAQAKEAKIEVALEKIRARTMGMQRSDELAETAVLLFHELLSLDLELRGCGINIWEKDEKICTAWMSTPEGELMPPFHIPLTENPVFIRFYESRQSGEDFWVQESGEKELAARFKYLSSLPVIGELLTKDLNENKEVPGFVVDHVVNFSNGNLIFITYKQCPDEWDTFKRFGKVFEQTYTRFLDLQKAEAQSREAQIELALERVRARTMSMQQSNELPDAANLLFQQMQALGMPAWSAGYCIWDENKQGITLWMSSEGVMQPSFHMPLTVDPSLIHMKEAYERSEPFHVEAVGGDELVSHYRYMRTLPGIGEILDSIISAGHPLPTFQIFHCAYFSEGFLLFITYEPVPEAHDIFKRFGKVFDQTYRRFLDLQKAEAQAREAKIEAALERVRSKTMAMHKSDELLEVVNVLADQFVQLDFKFDNVSFGENNQEGDFKFWFTAAGQPQPLRIQVPYCDNPAPNRVKEAQKKGIKFFADVLSKEENRQWTQHLIDHSAVKLFPEKVKNYILSCDGYARSTSVLKNINLYIGNYKVIPYSEEENILFQRFAQVFEQSYTRFLDLQKAEAQAREAQIEAALEKVRSRSLAMHQSDELQDVVNAVFERLKSLGIEMNVTSIFIFKDGSKDWEQWVASADTDYSSYFHLPYTDNPIFNDLEDARKKGTEFYTITYSYEQKNDWFNYAFLNTEYRRIPEARKRFLIESKFYKVAFALAKHTGLQLCRYSGDDFSDSDHGIMKRFAKVFEQAYVRFLDLQKAEAQSREAQIELSLERVRAKTMAMHNSADVGDTAAVMVDELKKLGIETIRCGIGIMHEPGDMELWTIRTDDHKTEIIIGWLDMNMHPLLHGAFQSWRIKNESYSYELGGPDLLNYYNAINNYPGYPIRYDTSDLPKQIFHNEFHFAEGTLFAFSLQQLTDEQRKILKRFAGVFGQTYRRYLDLKTAESQARQAKIEAAMEKVRSRAMAMQRPEELVEVAQLLRTEMGLLGVEELETSSIYIHNETSGETECWYAIQKDQNLVSDHMTLNLKDTWVGRQMFDFYRSDEKKSSVKMQGENRKEWINYCAAHSDVLVGFYGEDIPDRIYHLYKFSNGYMGAASPREISEESWDLLQRATSVFSLAYTRFSDLQLAEAQAREATIEAALEKVRGKAMAMHNTNDLSSAASIVFTELRKLGIRPIRCGVGLLNRESRRAQLYSAVSSESGDSLALIGWVDLSGHDVLQNIYDTWLSNKDYFPELTGEQLKSYYELLLNGLSVKVPDWQSGQKQYGSFLPFTIGCLYAWSDAPYNEMEIKILKRFASIIDLTFRRYMDLQQSEASAKEAVKQAALDRVRADIASMRTISDLDRITPLIWNELKILGVPFIRCGVFIMDEQQQLIHTFLSTPDGKAIGAFHLPYTTLGNIAEVLGHWQQKKNYIAHWNESDFTEFAETLVRQGALSSSQQYLQTIPHSGFYLHFLPFLQGMLYVGNTRELGEEEIKLVQSVADAFATAYARYEDFNKLEAAKQTVEKTLVDLRQAQTQLVQAEKMASLGQLTAGIAHEIQNPLNFVNNFSEVSEELIKEMIDEANKGNIDEVKAIAGDLVQNLEKINHHGKRADSIVKGMLEHSRTSAGNMEPTDINALADEYLRLSYHGFRAKDKSFNTAIHTEFDHAIGKINIIGQDIGRVLLNLYNNAFYAVNEKKKFVDQRLPTFESLAILYGPAVSVSTKKSGDFILISVKDNGNGIPQNIVDKIFQPFFTTKPTGSGTGLGLSLAYDIVKAHGGELKVDTTDGEETIFTISLPLLN